MLWYGTTLLIDHRLDVGLLFGFTLYTMFVGGSIGSFADLYANLQRSIGATQHVRELLDTPRSRSPRRRRSRSTHRARLRGDVAFDERRPSPIPPGPRSTC